MLGENKNLKNLKDISSPSPFQGEGQGEVNLVLAGSMSYTKTNKLITALYMVTDIIDKDEPLRNKLRTLGTGIISDTHLIQYNHIGQTTSQIQTKIAETVSFLDLASTMNIISEMNCSILKKEFLKLSQSIKEASGENETTNRQINLAEFFNSDEVFSPPLNSPHPNPLLVKERGNLHSKGHTRIGVQKGSTLLKALSDKTSFMSDMKSNHVSSDVFVVLKKQRRDNIININNLAGGNATIKDIKDKIQTVPEQAGSLVSCSEKTLQRELVSMVHSGVLYKTGEKRWSRYFVKN